MLLVKFWFKTTIKDVKKPLKGFFGWWVTNKDSQTSIELCLHKIIDSIVLELTRLLIF